MHEEILKELTILYVEDDLSIKNNTVVTLELVGAKVIGASDGRDGLNKFKEYLNDIDIILTDLSMPKMNGIEMIEEVQKIQKDIPIVITSAHQEINYLKKAIEAGVTSYILKPIEIFDIIDAIIKAIEPVKLKKELLLKNQELIELNNSLEEKIEQRTKEIHTLTAIDSLTKINNRRSFFKLSEKVFDEVETNLYAVIIDIDNFKEVNDTFGHKFGDEILILLARTIKKELNNNDIFGRIGGEEFAIIFTTEEDYQIKIENIRKNVQKVKYKDISITISLGASQKIPNDSIDSLLSRADDALYEAKETGRNKLIFRGK